MKPNKESVRVVLKLFLGSLVIYYVLHSKMVDFNALHSVLWSPGNLVLGFFFLTLSVLFSAARWRLLVRAQGLSLSYGHLVELSFIGAFFNTFMPGAVGGDLIKAWYIAGREPQRKTLAIFTVLLDRGLGLTVILFYSATTLLFFTEWLSGRPQFQGIALGIWGFASATLVISLLFFTSRIWSKKRGDRFLSFFKKSRRVGVLVDATLVYRQHLGSVLLASLLSALSILGMIVLHKMIGNGIGIPLTFSQYLFLVPLAMTVSAVPLLPGGIGVGQVAFFTLFKWMGVPDPDQGGALCTLIQIYTLLFSLAGLVPYLRYKRHNTEAARAEGPVAASLS